MKDLKRMEARIHWSECLHLGMLTLCLALPIALLFTADNPYYRLLWALGTVIPVQLIRWICDKAPQRSQRVLLSFAVLGATLFLTRQNHHWVYYLACCAVMLLSGLALPRPRDQMLFTVPRAHTLILAVPAFALGKAVGVEMLAGLAVVLTALMTLNYLVYTNQVRLLRDILMARGTEVSIQGVIRQNRRILGLYLLLGILVIGTIPFLLQRENREQPERPVVEYVEQTIAVESTEPARRDYMDSGDSEPLDLELYKDILIWLLIGIPAVAFVIGLVYGLILIHRHLKDLRSKKHARPEDSESLTIERLEADGGSKKRERLTGYEKKIRRRYEKLIRSRTARQARLGALTPTELGQAAGLSGDGAEAIRGIYWQTRYSGVPATRESYSAFQEAVHGLAPAPVRKDAEAQE